MASIPRHRRPQVALAVAIALVVLGVGLAHGRRDGGRPPADVGPTVQEPSRHDLGGRLRSWVTRIVAGPSTLVDARGHRWLPDSGYLGGQSSVTSAGIEGTSSQSIYQHERWGMRGYVIQVPAPATYAVNLYLAETRFS